jgi:hypothetical protein
MEVYMNRSDYYNYIDAKLSILSYRVTIRGKLNILDFHLHSENFYMYLLNLLYGWNLENMNSSKQNVEAIDLIDNINKIIIQVSATSTKAKIETALQKEIFTAYPDYSFKFLSIANEATDLRTKTFSNPHKVCFEPVNDVIDIQSISRKVLSLEIDRQRELYELVKKELGSDIDTVKLYSDLALIIGILSEEDLSYIEAIKNLNPYEIDKKILFNNLKTSRLIIDDFKIYYNMLDKKYKEFDKLGVNKSFAVLHSIRKQYITAISENEYVNADMLFLGIIQKVRAQVMESKNYTEIPFEELDLCVNILVVDAFIRCKIFENPEGYDYVTTR